MNLTVVKKKIRPLNIIILVLLAANISIMYFAIFNPIIKELMKEYKTTYAVFFITTIIAFWLIPQIHKNYIIIGKIIISNSSIKTTMVNSESTESQFGDMKQIICDFQGTANDGGRSIKTGISNYITIINNHEKVDKYQILIKNKKGLNQINKKVKYINKEIQIRAQKPIANNT